MLHNTYHKTCGYINYAITYDFFVAIYHQKLFDINAAREVTNNPSDSSIFIGGN